METAIGHWIRDRRKALGYSQAALAQEMGISSALVSHWETGRIVPSASMVAQLMDILGPPRSYQQEIDKKTLSADPQERSPGQVEHGNISYVTNGTVYIPNSLARHSFVQVEGQIDGIGKVIGVDSRHAVVEYFVSPAGPEVREVRVPVSGLRAVELSSQTRVYWFDEQYSSWRAGRVDGGFVSAQALRATEDHYHVRFPNGQDVRVPVSKLYVRWSHPIADPTDHLAARITDTPFFFDGRAQIVRFLASQHAAFGGLTGLASAAIELLEHQVTIIRRVLADPIERYLLADEVGLGKTIEAGVLIHQHVIDCPNTARVLVVVPRHLESQWRAELRMKCFLSDDKVVSVVAEERVRDRQVAVRALTMLVVDEAHRSALRAFHPDPEERHLYEELRALAMRVPRLLLLSGMPVLHQEEGFLAMLHLLDPDGYPLEDREAFRRRVRDRQAIAEATADLADDASAIFVEEAVGRVETLFPDDTRLQELSQTVRAYVDHAVDDPRRVRALRLLRTHLSGTYRLHRRLLRTRRDDPRVRDHLPRRAGAVLLEYEDPARAETFDFLDAWRWKFPASEEARTRHVHDRLFALLVESALVHPRLLLSLIDARLAVFSGQQPPHTIAARDVLASPSAFDGEEALLQERRTLIAGALVGEPRADRLLQWLESNREVRKVVLFVSDRELGDRVAAHLKRVLGSSAVLRHDIVHLGEDERSFLEDDPVRILVCDAAAEEGLNLQRVGAAVVHYDLPLEAARIEQRIGRVDRIEARGRMRNVVFSSGSPYEQEWLACLTDTIRVFERSIAPLQYVLLEASARVRERFVAEGRAAIEAESVRMRDPQAGIEAELRRIRAQEALDSLEADPERDRAFFETLEQADGRAEDDGSKAFDGWVVKCLQFERQEHARGHFRYVHVGKHPKRPTLMPLFDAVACLEKCIDRDCSARRFPSDLPFLPVTFERAVSEKAGIGLLRVGHPFVDGMEALVRADDRGAAFAMWRHVPGGWDGPPRLFFRFDFLIETDVAKALTALSSVQASPEALRRRADEAFPVEYRTLWLDSDLNEVGDPRLMGHLELPYSKAGRSDGGTDVNLRLERWDAVDVLVPVGDWDDLCRRARRKAEDLLRANPGFRERCRAHAQRVRDAASSAEGELQSRIARLPGATRAAEQRVAEVERRLADGIAGGIETPSVRVECAGAVYLSYSPLGEVSG